jgi:RNA polymerase sigma-70 factor (ECF subfamily)
MQPSGEGENRIVTIIYQLYRQPILRFMHSRYPSLDDDTAEDILSEVFVRVWERRSRLRAVRNILSYLQSVARNVVIDRYRKPTIAVAGIPAAAPSGVPLPTAAIERLELTREISNAIRSLSTSHQIVLELNQFGLSAMQISSRIGCSENIARLRLQQARKQLRIRLSRCGRHCAMDNCRPDRCAAAQNNLHCLKWIYFYDLRCD